MFLLPSSCENSPNSLGEAMLLGMPCVASNAGGIPDMLAAGREENLKRLHDELINKDWFQTLPDFNAYVVRKGQALSDYACDPLGWRKKCVINIAKAGMFSSDRTIAEYNDDIWHLGE